MASRVEEICFGCERSKVGERGIFEVLIVVIGI